MSDIGYELGRSARGLAHRVYRWSRVLRLIDTVVLAVCLVRLRLGAGSTTFTILVLAQTVLDWLVWRRLNPKRLAKRSARRKGRR